MTPEQQRIAIAEACGWKFRKNDDGSLSLFEPKFQLWIGLDDDPSAIPEWYAFRLPNYINDLNAMREALRILTGTNRGAFLFELRCLAGDYYAIDANAAQYAEAFLKTIGKWKD